MRIKMPICDCLATCIHKLPILYKLIKTRPQAHYHQGSSCKTAKNKKATQYKIKINVDKIHSFELIIPMPDILSFEHTRILYIYTYTKADLFRR